jgi:large-conductance mechanosensitive channel
MAWLLAVLYPGVIIGLAFEMPVSLVVKRILAGLVAYAIGAVLGAWLYKEEATPAV